MYLGLKKKRPNPFEAGVYTEKQMKIANVVIKLKARIKRSMLEDLLHPELWWERSIQE